MSCLGIADAMEAEGYPLTPEQREIIDAAEAQLSDALGVQNEPDGLTEARAEVLAQHRSWMADVGNREGMTAARSVGGEVSSEAAALARPLLAEAVRRIVEQDAAATKLKKRRAKRKRLKKLAKKQGRNR